MTSEVLHSHTLALTGMIFISCKDGISHNEIEYASPEHVTAGANVLLQVMMEYAKAQ
ncbi:N-carbamoyl-L-amino-acid hydrolase [Kosakonia oryziphila]|uniref:N-carbamoyl-L-amino-acid hydrolase n=1 Tax=Kosakonia oryziphila TaxID=1005667 RepID=A0A1C4E314_9ENTR|nr:N-carbamoyl-L-amino-acid hydrolase [Kosakonia oryziphila]